LARLSPQEIVVLFLALGVLLATARLLGELVRRWNQPSVLGEILAGILLGPTVLGRLWPAAYDGLFPAAGQVPVVLDGLVTLSVVLFLLVAGLELDLSTVWRQGRAALSVSVAGIVIPFAVGLAGGWFAPSLLGREPGAEPLVFALFFATALSISALPVIAKTLMDLGLYRTDLGMVVIAAAIFDDLTGWIIFAVVLGMMGGSSAEHGLPVSATIALTLGFAAVMLTVGRWLIHRTLPFLHAHTSWPGGILGFALALALFGAAFTEWIGVHAIFGAFLVGVALGDSSHLREQTRATIDRFVSFIFAPLFFASIGLRVDFVAHFDLTLVTVVLLIATAGKIGGCALGGRLGGMSWRETLAVGFGMNARGAMEIILGLLALRAGVIGERLFVALVVMALVTSIVSGPMMQRLLQRKTRRRFTSFLSARTFLRPLAARDRWAAIKELSRVAAAAADLDPDTVAAAVTERERMMSTGVGQRLAVPHARLEGLARPVVAVGVVRPGVDFDTPDGELVELVCLLLTPAQDDGAQVEILADIAATFRDPAVVDRAVAAADYVEFLSWIRTSRGDIHGVA
jgi:Kef-type K+ transport system membrane component KefB/mannitol/fructose-specific phosphotransferase system IIA component